jgi:hypothetical protein
VSLPLVSVVAPVKYDESTGSRSPQRCPGPDAAQLRLEYSHTCICGPTCVQRWVPHVQYVVSKSKKTLQCPSWNATAMLAIVSATTASRRAPECRDCRVRAWRVATASPPPRRGEAHAWCLAQNVFRSKLHDQSDHNITDVSQRLSISISVTDHDQQVLICLVSRHGDCQVATPTCMYPKRAKKSCDLCGHGEHILMQIHWNY